MGGALSAVSLIGGLGVGAAMMYLLDPEAGSRRRERLVHAAGDAAHCAGEALDATMHGLGETVHRASSALHSTGQGAAEQGRSVRESIAASLHELRPAAQRMYSRAMHYHHAGRREWVKDAVLVTTAAALGAGLMMLFDPREGRRRREAIREKVSHGLEETSRLARNTGRYIAEHSRGMRRSEEEVESPESMPQSQI